MSQVWSDPSCLLGESLGGGQVKPVSWSQGPRSAPGVRLPPQGSGLRGGAGRVAVCDQNRATPAHLPGAQEGILLPPPQATVFGFGGLYTPPSFPQAQESPAQLSVEPHKADGGCAASLGLRMARLRGQLGPKKQWEDGLGEQGDGRPSVRTQGGASFLSWDFRREALGSPALEGTKARGRVRPGA